MNDVSLFRYAFINHEKQLLYILVSFPKNMIIYSKNQSVYLTWRLPRFDYIIII